MESVERPYPCRYCGAVLPTARAFFDHGCIALAVKAAPLYDEQVRVYDFTEACAAFAAACSRILDVVARAVQSLASFVRPRHAAIEDFIAHAKAFCASHSVIKFPPTHYERYMARVAAAPRHRKRDRRRC